MVKLGSVVQLVGTTTLHKVRRVTTAGKVETAVVGKFVGDSDSSGY